MKKNKERYESEKILNDIANNILSNLSQLWSAKNVIDNRSRLNPYGVDRNSVIDIRQRIGMWEYAKNGRVYSVKVRDGGNVYDIEKLKKSKAERKKMESELMEYLKKHKI